MVWTVNDAATQNPPQYHLFDDITVCFSTPSLGAAVLTDITAAVVSQCLDPGAWSVRSGKIAFAIDFTPVRAGISGSTTSVQTCWLNVP